MDNQRKYRGAEIEFLAEPGNYLVSIDNGPAIEVEIEPEKDITFKTSVFLSPGSNYSIFNTLTGTVIPFRDKGHPIFVLPGSYKIFKKIITKQGIITGRQKKRLMKIDPNVIVTPSF